MTQIKLKSRPGPVRHRNRFARRNNSHPNENTIVKDRRTEWELDDYEPEEASLAPQLIGEYFDRYLVVREKRLNCEHSHVLDRRYN